MKAVENFVDKRRTKRFTFLIAFLPSLRNILPFESPLNVSSSNAFNSYNKEILSSG